MTKETKTETMDRLYAIAGNKGAEITFSDVYPTGCFQIFVSNRHYRASLWYDGKKEDVKNLPWVSSKLIGTTVGHGFDVFERCFCN